MRRDDPNKEIAQKQAMILAEIVKTERGFVSGLTSMCNIITDERFVSCFGSESEVIHLLNSTLPQARSFLKTPNIDSGPWALDDKSASVVIGHSLYDADNQKLDPKIAVDIVHDMVERAKNLSLLALRAGFYSSKYDATTQTEMLDEVCKGRRYLAQQKQYTKDRKSIDEEWNAELKEIDLRESEEKIEPVEANNLRHGVNARFNERASVLELPIDKFRRDAPIIVVQRIPRYILLAKEVLKNIPLDKQSNNYDELNSAYEDIKNDIAQLESIAQAVNQTLKESNDPVMQLADEELNYVVRCRFPEVFVDSKNVSDFAIDFNNFFDIWKDQTKLLSSSQYESANQILRNFIEIHQKYAQLDRNDKTQLREFLDVTSKKADEISSMLKSPEKRKLSAENQIEYGVKMILRNELKSFIDHAVKTVQSVNWGNVQVAGGQAKKGFFADAHRRRASVRSRRGSERKLSSESESPRSIDVNEAPPSLYTPPMEGYTPPVEGVAQRQAEIPRQEFSRNHELLNMSILDLLGDDNWKDAVIALSGLLNNEDFYKSKLQEGSNKESLIVLKAVIDELNAKFNGKTCNAFSMLKTQNELDPAQITLKSMLVCIMAESVGKQKQMRERNLLSKIGSKFGGSKSKVLTSVVEGAMPLIQELLQDTTPLAEVKLSKSENAHGAEKSAYRYLNEVVSKDRQSRSFEQRFSQTTVSGLCNLAENYADVKLEQAQERAIGLDKGGSN